MLMLPLMLCAGCTAQVAPTTEEASVPSEIKGGSDAEAEVGEMITAGSEDSKIVYNYIYIKSNTSSSRYFHISYWKRYATNNNYVDLEITLAVSKQSYRFYEQNLIYVLAENYNNSYGIAEE